MMISSKGPYALRVMIDLAQNQTDGYLPLHEIAVRQQISEKYLESILRILVRSHLLIGLRGKGGGYRLAKPAKEYTIGSILRLTEGDLAPVSCLEGTSEACPRKDICPTFPVWQKLDRLIQNYLDSITLEDLL